MWIALPLLALALLPLCGCGKKCKLTSGEYKCSCLYCRGTDLECKGHRGGKKDCDLWCRKCNKKSVVTERIAPYD